MVLKNSSPILGLLENTSDNWFKTNSFNQNDLLTNKLTKKQILELIEKRANAKTKKDFELADKIRKSLDDEGIVLEDNANGTDWRYK